MKMTMMTPGWSAAGGQTLSPYIGQIEKGKTLLGHSVCSMQPHKSRGNNLPRP